MRDRCTTDYLYRMSYWKKIHRPNYEPLTEEDQEQMMYDVIHTFGNDHMPEDAPALVASTIREQHDKRRNCRCDGINHWRPTCTANR